MISNSDSWPTPLERARMEAHVLRAENRELRKRIAKVRREVRLYCSAGVVVDCRELLMALAAPRRKR